MANPAPLTRAQLARFLPDQELIRRFEQLFQEVGVNNPTQIALLFRLTEEAAIAAGVADSKAIVANDSLERVASALEVLASRPDFAMPRRIPADYIEFARTPAYPGIVRNLAWNAADDTLNLHHSDGVTQQIGQELYGRILNSTGSTIADGTALGYSPSINNFVPFIANGTLSALNIVGVTTQPIPNGAYGRITVWGRVRGIDTTGAPYSETWALGDVLYVSPTIAGGFTKVKPTAPNLSIPIGQVVVLSATVGEIAVRPTIEQTLYYGTFVKTADQSPSAINTAQPITWSSALSASGISIGSPTSRIVVANAGLYRFSASFQLTSTSASVKNVWLWYRKNGADIANSSQIVSLDSGTAVKAPTRDMFFSLAANDYIELIFACDSTAVDMDFVAANSFAPAAPAAILSVTQERQ